jgi:LCP family protein required for cell wall assembly
MIIAGTMVGMTLISALILISMSNSDKNNNKASANSQNIAAPTSIIYEDAGALEGNSLLIEPWDGEDRFTVLLMGLDSRPGETNAACRTDTMMLVSIDPVTDRIGILSIPRDTFVEVPNYGLRKINTACVIGNLELNGHGPQLAMQTVQYNFGIEVNDYLMVDFNTFIEIIDLIGGVDVNAIQTIDDPEYPDMNYGFDAFYLPAGPHHLDGATALKYARSRYASDDIDRGRRQQEVVFAVRNRILSRDMIDDLITRAIPLWNELSDGVDTGLSIEQLIRLALYAKDIPDENIRSAVLGWDYLVPYNSPEDGSVLVPDRELIAPLLLDVFGQGYND